MLARMFIEVPIFTKLLEEIGGKSLLKRIQDEIIKDPSKGDVIPGTGGVRKIRISKDSSGKSGGYRVIYLDLPEKRTIYLLTIYDKRVKENITEEQKKVIRILAQKLKGE